MNIGGIYGEIESLSPRVQIVVSGPDGDSLSMEAVLDTGFNGVVSISPRDAETLRLKYLGQDKLVLADGTVRECAIFAGRVLFAGEWRDVPITTTGDVALVGMQLIYGARLTLDVFLDGDIDLEFMTDRRIRWDLS